MPKVVKKNNPQTQTHPRTKENSLSTEKEKYERRLAANRRSARKSRYRRKVLLDELQETVKEMTAINAALRRENEEIRRQLAKYSHFPDVKTVLTSNVKKVVRPAAGSSDVDTRTSHPEVVLGGNNPAPNVQPCWLTRDPNEPMTNATRDHLHERGATNCSSALTSLEVQSILFYGQTTQTPTNP